MYAKKIKFTDFNGNEREQTFYFNLTEAELTEMNLSKEGGLEAYVTRIVNANDVPQLSELFKTLILKSYGEKSDDGMRFMKKNGALAAEFAETEAYSELYMELATNTDAASEFINGLIPKKLADKATQIQKSEGHAYPPNL